jgi:hypothetical protein
MTTVEKPQETALLDFTSLDRPQKDDLVKKEGNAVSISRTRTRLQRKDDSGTALGVNWNQSRYLLKLAVARMLLLLASLPHLPSH